MADWVDKLSEPQCERIIAAFRANDQLHNSMYLVNKSNRLKKFLERTTGREFEISGRDIREVKEEADLDDVPF